MLIRIIILLILIGINGILSSSEIAFLSLNKYKLSLKKDKKSKKILNIIQDESSFLSIIQIGITLSGFLASAFASDSFTEILMNYGIHFINEQVTENILMIFITILLSYITLVFGELVPKKIGRSNPEKVATRTINIILFVRIVFKPIIYLLKISTDFICKILNIKERIDTLTESDIRRLIITGSKEGVVEEKEKEYILNIFNFNDKTVYKAMTPKENVVWLDINSNTKKILKTLKKYHYTRYPILENNKVLGYINVKDLIYIHQSKKTLNIKNLIHQCLIFEKSKKIDDAFRIMQEEQEVFSIIIDKENNFIGILTTEDAVEEIVGEIENEYSKKETN